VTLVRQPDGQAVLDEHLGFESAGQRRHPGRGGEKEKREIQAMGKRYFLSHPVISNGPLWRGWEAGAKMYCSPLLARGLC